MSITCCQLHIFWEVGRGTGGSGNGCAVTSKISRKSRLEGCNLESQKSASALRDRWMGWEGDLKANQNQSQWNGLECDTKLCFKQMERRCDENNASLVREPGEPLLGQPFKGLGKRREVRSVPGQLTMMSKITMMRRWRTLNWKANIIIIIIIIIFIIMIVIIIITINVYELLWVEEPTLNKDVFHLPARLCNQKWRKW